MSEVNQLQRLANALKSYKGSKLSAYVDALPEMVASGASGMAGVVPGVVSAYESDGPLTEKAQAFLKAQDENSFDPSLDPRVLEDLDAATPEVAKRAMLGYDEWAKANPTAALIPDIAASTFGRALRAPVKVEWDQLRGHPNEDLIRQAGRFSTDGGKTWIHWDPNNVDTRGMPNGQLIVKSGLNAHIGGDAGDRTTAMRREGVKKLTRNGTVGRENAPDFFKVQGSWNDYSGAGSGGGNQRYNALRDNVFANDLGIGSSNQNTVHSTGSWQGLAGRSNDVADSFMAEEFGRQGVNEMGGFTGTFMMPGGNAINNFTMYPKDKVPGLKGYTRNAGWKRDEQGRFPHVGASHARQHRSIDPETGLPRITPVYGDLNEIFADPANRTNIPHSRSVQQYIDNGQPFPAQQRERNIDPNNPVGVSVTRPSPVAQTPFEREVLAKALMDEGRGQSRWTGAPASAQGNRPQTLVDQMISENSPRNANNPETIDRLTREFNDSQRDGPLPKMDVEEIPDADPRVGRLMEKLDNSRAAKRDMARENTNLQERDMNQRRVIRDKRDILAAQNRVISNKRGVIEALREKLTREQGRSGAISRGQAERDRTRERMLELGRTPEQADIASDSAKYRFLRNEGYPEQADEFRRRILGLPRYQR